MGGARFNNFASVGHGMTLPFIFTLESRSKGSQQFSLKLKWMAIALSRPCVNCAFLSPVLVVYEVWCAWYIYSLQAQICSALDINRGLVATLTTTLSVFLHVMLALS